MANFIFALTLGRDVQLLPQNAVAIIWVLFVLTIFLPVDQIWAEDWQDGTLEQMLSLGIKGWQLSLAKSLRHFLLMLPTIFLAMAGAALFLQLPSD